MRTQKSFVNLVTALGTQLINIVLVFGLRTVFIKMLSTEYLGMNGLFSNILTFLSFAELGFGSAISFSLYKPLAYKDEQNIAGIMNFFKKIYKTIGFFVLIAGLLITPFIDFFIEDTPDIKNIKLIFILFVLNSAVSYWGSYKATLIIADQRKHIADKSNLIIKIVTVMLQAIVLLLFRSYILYLIAAIVGTVMYNIYISLVADKYYTYLKKYKNTKIQISYLNEIKKNVNATILHKIGAVLILGTDNILLSKFFSLTIVGLYSNYYIVISNVNSLLGQVQSAVWASVGNLGAEATNEKKLEVFETYYLLNFWLFAFSSICLVVMFNPFIDLWLGEEFFLPLYVVIILVLNYFLAGFRSAAAVFDNSFGLFWNTRFLPIIESILNLVLSLILLNKIGYIGVFLGTTLSSIITGLWFEPYVLYKKGFNISPFKYFIMLIKSFLVLVIDYIICYIIIKSIIITGFWGFVFKCLIVFVSSNLIILLFYIRTAQFESLLKMALGILTGIINKFRKE